MGLTITELVEESYATAADKGWWTGRCGSCGGSTCNDNDTMCGTCNGTGTATPCASNVGEKLALIHSEVSEALEDWRLHGDAGLSRLTRAVNDKPEGFPSELADILIRVGDLCGRYGIDLEAAVVEKLAYNKTRSYRHGGKHA